MRLKLSVLFNIVLFVILSTSCNRHQEPEIVDLWENGAPTENELTETEELIGDGYLAINISKAQLYIHKPISKPNGKAVIICPGGGYEAVAISHEGHAFAEWLASKGTTGIVLKYRLPNNHKEIPQDDIQEAIRYVRTNANQLGINSEKVGVTGFSAGGHIATTASVHYTTTEISTRPDFTILFYPVVTMQDSTHVGTRTQLIGADPSPEDIKYYSNELHVTKDTPPTIIFLSSDDSQVPPTNSYTYYKALTEKGVSAALYAFPKGTHGWGMSPEHMEFRYYNEMLILLDKWLEDK